MGSMGRFAAHDRFRTRFPGPQGDLLKGLGQAKRRGIPGHRTERSRNTG